MTTVTASIIGSDDTQSITYHYRIVHVSPVPIELAWDFVGGELRLALCGELCKYSAQLVAGTLNRLLVTSVAERAILDLSGVEFVDGRGVSLLLNARRTARRTGVTLRVVRPSRCVARVLEMCGIDPSLAGDGESVAIAAAERFEVA
jgi:anti-anti-sigma factor